MSTQITADSFAKNLRNRCPQTEKLVEMWRRGSVAVLQSDSAVAFFRDLAFVTTLRLGLDVTGDERAGLEAAFTDRPAAEATFYDFFSAGRGGRRRPTRTATVSLNLTPAEVAWLSTAGSTASPWIRRRLLQGVQTVDDGAPTVSGKMGAKVVRLTPTERAWVRHSATVLGLTLSEYGRRCLGLRPGYPAGEDPGATGPTTPPWDRGRP